jgi:HK97 family phage portal protein
MRFIDKLFNKNKETISKGLLESEFETAVSRSFNINYNTMSSYDAQKLLRGLVTTCIDTRAQIFAQSIPLIYRNVAGNDTRKNKIVEDNEFISLLYNPNPFTSYFELMQQLETNLCNWGDCYWYISRNIIGRPASIEVLHPYFVKYVSHNSNGYPTGVEYKASYVNNKQQTIYISLDDIIHFKIPSYDPTSLYGTSIIQKNSDAIEIYLYESMYQKSLLKNGGVTDKIFKAKQKLTPEQLEKFENDFKEKHSSPKNAGRPMIIPLYMEPANLTYNPVEIGYLESKKMSKIDILNMFKVHPAMLGDAEGVNKSNGYIGINAFLSQVITPIAKMVDAKITQFVKKNYNPKFYFEQKLPFKLDEEQEIKRYDLGLKTGSISKNEYRTFMDYDNVDFSKINENDYFSNKYTVNDANNNNDTNNNNPDTSNDKIIV